MFGAVLVLLCTFNLVSCVIKMTAVALSAIQINLSTSLKSASRV